MSALSAEQYLASMKKDASRDRFFFMLNENTEHDPMTWKAIEYMISREPNKDWGRELSAMRMSQALLAEMFEKNLFDDLSQRIAPEDQPILNACLIGVIPLHGINGHAQSRDFWGNPLDRSLLLINYGVYFVCSYLATALTLEILDGSLAAYRQSGKNFFHAAQYYYRNQRLPDDLLGKVDLGCLPLEVAAEIRWHTGRLSAIMMWFVGLHEFAHIRHGDIESHFWKSMCPNGELPENTTDRQMLFMQEEEADKYAVERLGAWKDGRSNVWSNFAQAYLLMKFLEIMEGQSTIVNSTHPPARRRKELMLAHAANLVDHDPPSDYAAYVEDIVTAWQSEIREV